MYRQTNPSFLSYSCGRNWPPEKKKQNTVNKRHKSQITIHFTEEILQQNPQSMERIFNSVKFTVIQGQLMPCKHIQSDYRWAMEILAYLEGIARESKAQATNQMLSFTVSSRSCNIPLGSWVAQIQRSWRFHCEKRPGWRGRACGSHRIDLAVDKSLSNKSKN